MKIVSFAQHGYVGEIIKVEADLRRGIPAIDIVGLPDGAVREARERMRAAIRNSGLDFPRERILINLSPADLKKEGSSFDLPIALAVLLAANPAITEGNPEEVMVLGELELSGAVRPVRGVLSAVSLGLERGIRRYIVPKQNEAEARIRKEARVLAVESVKEAIERIDEQIQRESSGDPAGGLPHGGLSPYQIVFRDESGYEDVRGQNVLVRALEIAAAGGHNVIAFGPPGCGKTLALQRFPSLLPDMDEETAVTVTRIHSIAGILEQSAETDLRSGALLRRPPFREPHPSASIEGMIGGGSQCRPGEISLSHGGTLFLDECAQFRSSVLQALRAPLETGSVTISRAGKADTFPARFQLLLAMNPCPCGNFGFAGRICTCGADGVEKYWKKMTAPLLDRIDLRVRVKPPSPEILTMKSVLSMDEIRQEIGQARRIQRDRNYIAAEYGHGGWLNAHLGPEDIEKICLLDSSARALFTESMNTFGLSARGGHGVLKVARTIADLECSKEITDDHLLEAFGFRRWSGQVPDFLR